MNWRPKEWRNPFKLTVTHDKGCWCPDCGAHKDFERGADAILGALKESGRFGRVTYFEGSCPEEGTGEYVLAGQENQEINPVWRLEDIAPEDSLGWIVFIPEDTDVT